MKRFNCTVGDKRGVNGECMELHESGKYLRYSEASNRILELENRVKNQSDKIAELEKEMESSLYFNVDVVRCLSKIAWEHYHDDIPHYMDLAKQCIKSIESKQFEALKEQGK